MKPISLIVSAAVVASGGALLSPEDAYGMNNTATYDSYVRSQYEAANATPEIFASVDANVEYHQAVIDIEFPPPPPPPPPRAVPVSYNPPPPSANGNSVLEEAYRHIGKPYVLGGKGPDVFDCSGYVSYVFAQVGVSIPSTVAGITASGRTTAISYSDARPGDLMVWPGHVAIYAGDGQRIDANRPGSTIQVRPSYGSPTYYRVS